jgi:hypothetical protein
MNLNQVILKFCAHPVGSHIVVLSLVCFLNCVPYVRISLASIMETTTNQ